jgi:hypothetical protein
MACNCPSLAQAESGAVYIRCVRGALGLVPSVKWDDAAHVALYAVAARQVEVLSERHQAADTIRAVVFGSEPDVTADYVMRLGDWLPAESEFWLCLGITKAESRVQRLAGSGEHWLALAAAGGSVRASEGLTKDGGLPLWGWGLAGAAVIFLVWLALR